MFLMCLYKAGMLKQEDSKLVVNYVFNSYLTLVRKLQTTYKMEPAGSHGVWSLDDFQFLPFIFGSSQLSGKSKHCTTVSSNSQSDSTRLISTLRASQD